MTKLIIKNATVITLFALVHSIVAILSRYFEIVDDIPLTLLTVLMIVVISLKNRVNIEIVTTMCIVACFLGYPLGVYGASLINILVNNNVISPAITTFIITQFIGWITVFIENRLSRGSNIGTAWMPNARQIVVIAVIIIALRLSYTLVFNSLYFTQAEIYFEFHKLMTNGVAQLIIICAILLFINTKNRFRVSKEREFIVVPLFILIFSAIITLMIESNIPYSFIKVEFTPLIFFRLYLVVLFINIIMYAIITLITSTIRSDIELKSERIKKLQVQYSYSRLKQQLNPHFLFNSLNILDYMVQDNQNDRASAYIGKLATLYRYMLKYDEKQVITIKEELEFAIMYIDLLKERFANGLNVTISVEERYYKNYIVPCSLQLLLENAIKHNIVSRDQPLEIEISIDVANNFIVVKNNLQLRISEQSSTHIGLANIQEQYKNVLGRDPKIESDKDFFYVKLPIL